MPTILVTGQNGQVAQSLRALAGHRRDLDFVFLARPELDLTNHEDWPTLINDHAPDLIINAAAYTDVERAEQEPDLCHRINAIAPSRLGCIAHDRGIPIIQISTDFVFSGDQTTPYAETVATGPLNVYGHSKLLGEHAIRETTDNHVILRASWVYSPYGRNFVKSILAAAQTRPNIEVVDDQWGGPTYAHDLAEILISMALRLIDDSSTHLRGLFHLGGRMENQEKHFTHRAHLAKAAIEIANGLSPHKATIVPIKTKDHTALAQRPLYACLDGSKLLSVYGLTLPDYGLSLDDCIKKLLSKA